MMNKRGQHKNFWLALSFIGILVAIAMPAFAWLNIAQVSNQPGFSNYTITDPITIAVGESAGLKTSADFAADPYGPNLQPGADMSGTGGTTSGAGTVNGDVADDWKIYTNSGATITAGKTSNDYQKMYASGNYSILYTDGISIVTGDIYIAEWYASGVQNSPQMRVQTPAGSNIQTYDVIVDGYGRSVFTSNATFTGGITVLTTADTGCTIHWTRLRKLSGANGIMTELDRTLRANGTELHTDANAASDPNGNEADATTGWQLTPDGGALTSDSAVKDVGSYSLKFVSSGSADGAYKDFQTDFGLVNGDRVQLTFSARHDGVAAGTGSIRFRFASNTGLFNDVTDVYSVGVAGTTFKPVVYEYTHSANFRYFGPLEKSVENDGGVYWDNLSVQKMQPTLTTIKRVASVETVLDTSYVDYSAGADLVTVKDGTNFNVFYNNTKITEETISDASVIYNKIHGSYGDSAADATIVRLALEAQVLANSEFTDTTLGAEKSSGALTLGRQYKITAHTDQDFTADGAADNNVGTEFIATDTTVTLDANNKVQERTLDDWAVSGTRDATAYLVMDADNDTLRIVTDGDYIGVNQDVSNATLYKYELTIDAVVSGALKLTGIDHYKRAISSTESGYIITDSDNIILSRDTFTTDVTVKSFKLWPVKTE